MKSYSDFGIDIPSGRNSGKMKVTCPKCRDRRTNKRDKSLSVDLDKGVWHCHYCSWSGTIHVGERSHDAPKKEYRRPTPRPITTLSRKLVEWFNSRGISENTLKKMRINEGEHFMPQKGKKMNTVQFNYYLNDELINVKYRTGSKDFMLESGAELIPYNLDSITGQSECIITEGEMDCLSFVEIGKTNCVSVPNGANSNLTYLDDFIDGWFEDKETIYIASDTDTKGLLLRDELIRRFGAERCKIVTYGDDCKDANEHLQKYGKESLENCLRKAKEVKVDGVFSLNDYEEELDSIYEHGLQKGFLVGHPNLDALISFETKRLAIVTGIPGSGKSEFIDEMCVRLNILYDFKVGFFSPENMPMQYHAVKLVEKLCGKKLQSTPNSEHITPEQYARAKDYYRDNFFHVLPEDGMTIDNILAKAKYLVRRRGIRVFVLDPFNRIEHEQSRGETETQYISRLLNRMSAFAQQNDVLFILMAHPTKVRKDNGNGGIPTMYDISGSATFFDKADFGMVVHRERDESKNYTLVRVEKVKFRHLGQPGDATFKFNVINGRYIPWKQSESITVNFRADMDDMIEQKQNNRINIPQTQPELPWENLQSMPVSSISSVSNNLDDKFPFGPIDPNEPLPF